MPAKTPKSGDVHLRNTKQHPHQREFIESKAKRKVIRAGRRSGKTVGAADLAVRYFVKKCRVLYATPTADQVERFWFEVKRALDEPIKAGVLYKNETEHIIEVPGTLQRIRAKTAWNADTLRGDYADLLILDEYQLMNEDAWELVGAPMLLDNNGDAVFIYTPPSLRSASISKARDPRHAAKLYQRAAQDTSGRWAAFHFTSLDNPTISRDALTDITKDMSRLAYEQEILAEDKEDAPGALWKRALIESTRVTVAPTLRRIVVGVDPTVSSTGANDEAGIIVDGTARLGRVNHLYILEDDSLHGSPREWGQAAVNAYHNWQANCIVAESNQGGQMVADTIHTIDPDIPVKLVHASRGKATRAEPISAIHEQQREHHVGNFNRLEDELCTWTPGDKSPNRLDAHVWAATELMLGNAATAADLMDFYRQEYEQLKGLTSDTCKETETKEVEPSVEA